MLPRHYLFDRMQTEVAEEVEAGQHSFPRSYVGSIRILRSVRKRYDSALPIQSERAQQYAKEVNLKSVRSKAEAAWQAKDYGQLIELYHSMRKDLTEVEAKKLDYAEQQGLTVKGVTRRASFSSPRRV